MNLLTVVNLSGRPKMGSTKCTSAPRDRPDQNKTYFRVVASIPGRLLAKLSRSKGSISKRCQSPVSDSTKSNCSFSSNSRLNGPTRSPSSTACDAIHLRGGRLRSIPVLIAFPPPLHPKIGITFVFMSGTNGAYISECVPGNQTSSICG